MTEGDPLAGAPAASGALETSLIDRQQVCPACHRLLPTTVGAAAGSAHLLPPFEHRAAAISARRGSAGGAASKAEWARLRGRLEGTHGRSSGLGVHQEAAEGSEGANGEEESTRQGEDDTEPRRTEEKDSAEQEMTTTELKEALARVLSDVEALVSGAGRGRSHDPPRAPRLMGLSLCLQSSRHEALLANQLDLENSLKIARSNLTLAEANSEMLEEALRRGGNGFAGRMGPPRPATPTIGSGAAENKPAARSTPLPLVKPFTAPSDQPATPEHARPVLARRRSGSEGGAIAIPSPGKAGRPAPPERSNTLSGACAPPSATTATSPTSSLGGFWRRSLDKRPQLQMNLTNLASDMASAIPSPSAEARAGLLANLGMTLDGAAASAPSLGAGMPIERPETPRQSDGGTVGAPGGQSATATAQFELYRLRQTLKQTQTSLATLSEELTATKKAKTTVESELEALSQELFEEANKMVADERRARAGVEAEAAELKEERDALKRTMQLMEGEMVEARRSAEAERRSIEAIKGETKSGQGLAGDTAAHNGHADVAIAHDEETRGGSRERSLGWGAHSPSAPRRTVHTPMPADNDLDALMKRMEADFGKL